MPSRLVLISRVLNVQAEERSIAGWLFILSFLIGTARVFSLTASQAIFLDNYSASDLAYVYVITSVATIGTSALYLRVGRRFTPATLIATNLGVVLTVTLLLRIGLAAVDASWPAMALAVWFPLLFLLTNLAFWAVATKVLDIRQGKRLFPVITTGDVLAYSLGGFIILRVAGTVGTANLLLVSVVALAMALSTFLLISRRRAEVFASATPPVDTRPSAPPITWSGPYLRLMIAYFAISASVWVFVDNAFNDVAERQYADVAQLAQFFGTFSAVTALVNFAVRSLLAGRMVARLGLVAGLVALPVAVLLGSTVVAVGGTTLAAVMVVFWAMVFTRMSDKVFRGIQASSVATLYQPLMDRGPAIQTSMEGIVDAAAVGASGVLLLVLNTVFDLGAVQLAFFLIGFCIVWIAITVGLRNEYVRALANVLQRRRLKGGVALEVGADVMELVKGEFDSPFPEDVIYALDLLERAGHPELADILTRLLDHESVDVRKEVLRRIEKHRVVEALDGVRFQMLGAHNAPDVQGVAMRVLCALSEDAIQDGVDALQHERAELRQGALVGLLRSGSIQGIVYAGAELLRELGSEDPGDREFAAGVLAEAGMSSFYREALQLLRDPELPVRLAAIDAAARMDHPQLWPVLVDALRDRKQTAAASEALIAVGAPAIPSLVERFRVHEDDPHFRLSVLRIIGLIRSKDAAQHLYALADLPDRDERHAALAGMSNCGFVVTPTQAEHLREMLRTEASEVAQRFATIGDIEANPSADLLKRALVYEITRGRHRVFLLLSFLYPDRDVLTAWDNYEDGGPGKRAYAVELLENFVSTELKTLLFPVLEELPLSERLRRLAHTFPVAALGVQVRIMQMLAEPEGGFSRWTLQCARHLARQSGVTDATLDDEPLIVEQTLRLKAVELFRELPEYVLADIAPRLYEVTLEADQPVFRKGDVGDGLYIVSEGGVRVHDNGQTIGTLGPNSVFGEFTVLKAAKRTASVSTIERTRLLRFDQGDLYELLSERVPIARAMIQIILRRLEQNRPETTTASEGRLSRLSISIKPLE